MMLRLASLALMALILSNCASSRGPASYDESDPVRIPMNQNPVLVKDVNLQEFRRAIGLDTEELGYFEKPINSCSLPREMQASPNCETKYFTVINFQVVCRDSVGTVESVSEDDMTPMISKDITWVLGKNRGKTTTDLIGRGSVVAVTASSTSQRTLILKVKNLALGLSSTEVRRIVVPRNWCGGSVSSLFELLDSARSRLTYGHPATLR